MIHYSMQVNPCDISRVVPHCGEHEVDGVRYEVIASTQPAIAKGWCACETSDDVGMMSHQYYRLERVPWPERR